MKKIDEQEKSGLLIGSEPLGGAQYRSASKMDDNDGGQDGGDSDGVDADKSDSDGTDTADKGTDKRDADGRD